MGKNKEFILTELLIAIMAILVAITLPSYQDYIRKANRVTAQLTLSKLAQQFERANARHNGYPATISQIESVDTDIFALLTRMDLTFTISAMPISSSVFSQCGLMSIKPVGQATPNTNNCG